VDGEADYPSRFAIRFESAEYGGYDGELLLDYPGLSLTVNQGPARMIQFAGALTEFIDETLSFSGSFDSKWGSFLSVDNKLQYDSNLVALALNLLSDEWGTWTMTSSLGDLESSVWRLAAVVEQVYVYTIVIEPEVIIPPPVIEEPIVEAEPEPEPVVEEPVEEEEPAPAAPEDIGELGVDYIEMTVRLDTSLARYESDGGNDAFVEAVCSALGIETSRVTVMEVWEGSVNVRFRVQGGAGLSLEDLQRLLTERLGGSTKTPRLSTWTPTATPRPILCSLMRPPGRRSKGTSSLSAIGGTRAYSVQSGWPGTSISCFPRIARTGSILATESPRLLQRQTS
jgi:hypothetical protein